MASEEENNEYTNTLTSSISSPHLPFFVLNPLINTQNIIKHLLINKLFLLSFIFFISSLILPGSATPINIDSQQQPIILPVGSIFILEDNLANELSPRQQLPLWMRADLSNGKKRFFGIPQIRDVGKYQLMFLGYLIENFLFVIFLYKMVEKVYRWRFLNFSPARVLLALLQFG